MSLFTDIAVVVGDANERELRIICGYLIFTFLTPSLVFTQSLSTKANTGGQIVSAATISPNQNKIVLAAKVQGPASAIQTPEAVWPVTGTVTLEFGVPHWPYERYHTGMDIVSSQGYGAPVTVFRAGRVIEASYVSGYGNHVVVDHGNGLASLYGHLSRINVSVGQDVKPGNSIGLEGMTGMATGPHVHFEIRESGVRVNPRKYLPQTQQ
jgi:murein DD-endopeptidase MepM/ murein hydrolase activator NlpD